MENSICDLNLGPTERALLNAISKSTLSTRSKELLTFREEAFSGLSLSNDLR